MGLQNPSRGITALVLFGDESCDPKTEPWHDSDLIHVGYLDLLVKALAAKDPAHPLVAVFQPVFEIDAEALVSSAKTHDRRITRNQKLTQTQRDTLADVFEH